MTTETPIAEETIKTPSKTSNKKRHVFNPTQENILQNTVRQKRCLFKNLELAGFRDIDIGRIADCHISEIYQKRREENPKLISVIALAAVFNTKAKLVLEIPGQETITIQNENVLPQTFATSISENNKFFKKKLREIARDVFTKGNIFADKVAEKAGLRTTVVIKILTKKDFKQFSIESVLQILFVYGVVVKTIYDYKDCRNVTKTSTEIEDDVFFTKLNKKDFK